MVRDALVLTLSHVLLGVSQVAPKTTIIRPENGRILTKFANKKHGKRRSTMSLVFFFFENVLVFEFSMCVKGTFPQCYGVFCVF